MRRFDDGIYGLGFFGDAGLVDCHLDGGWSIDFVGGGGADAGSLERTGWAARES